MGIYTEYTSNSFFELFQENLEEEEWDEIFKAYGNYLIKFEKKAGFEVERFLKMEQRDDFIQFICKNHKGGIDVVVWVIATIYKEFFQPRKFLFATRRFPFCTETDTGMLYCDEDGFKAIIWEQGSEDPRYDESDFNVGSDFERFYLKHKGTVNVQFVPN